MRTRLMPLVLVLSSACLVTACGTATFDHVVKVTIVDPSRRLGNPPIEVGIFDKLPAYESAGYFIVSLQPVPGEDQRVTASFAPYGDYFAQAGSKVVPLPLRVRSEKGKQGWQIDMTIDVPPPPGR